MSSDRKVLVKVKDLYKDFILPQSRNSSVKNIFVNTLRGNKKVKQHLLKGINFEVNEGDFFGIVGRNGSGKSTLLKILAGVYSPTSGTADLYGPLTPFIELGVGFNPELSGRDNVFLNGALLGFSRKQMAALYDDIVQFSELEQFMDQKLKNYSSGMQVRLAFSIAVKAKNDILIFDEVLAVGDEAFQRKCLDVFERYKSEGQTVILVTHDMETVRRFCNKALLIGDGEVIELGDPRRVANKYSELNQKQIDKDIAIASAQNKSKYLKVGIFDYKNNPVRSFSVGDSLRVRLDWPGLDPDMIESVGVNIFRQSGEHITGINSRFGKIKSDWKSHGTITIDLKLDIAPGSYFVLPEIFEADGKRIDSITDGPRFIVKGGQVQWSGIVELEYRWLQ